MRAVLLSGVSGLRIVCSVFLGDHGRTTHAHAIKPRHPHHLYLKSETLCAPCVFAWISSRKFETFSAIFAQLFYLPAGEELDSQ